MIPGRWRPAFRIALRDLRKSPGRVALVMAMIGLPVLLVSTLATVIRSYDISDKESIPRVMGAAPALVTPEGRSPIDQNPQGEVWYAAKEPRPETRPWTTNEIEKVTGRRVITIAGTQSFARTPVGALTVDVFLGEFEKPELEGYITLNSGRFPAADDEVLASKAMADRGFTVGTKVIVGDEDSAALKIVGIGRTAADEAGPNEQIIARPKAAIEGDRTVTYLLTGAPISWSQIREFNQKGLAVASRAVIEDPPENWQSTLTDPSAFTQGESGLSAADSGILGLIIFTILFEVVLLAGPAFAVGERRQRRHLALMAASGASPADVRRVILTQGIVYGVLAAVIGAGLAIPVTVITIWAVPQFTPRITFGP
ncbi:MAG: hypothetical protein ACRC0L_11275, partial [Angustibacter sp.]